MTQRALVSALLAVATHGCSHEANGSSHVEEPSGRESSTCTPTGAENARARSIVTLPVGCGFTRGGSESSPLVVADAASYASAVECTGAAAPSIDFAVNDLYLVTYTLSPASRGIVPLDDGSTVFMTTRFRSPCPDDPMPMPMSATMGFLLPKNATRAFRSANCTLPDDCR